MMHDVKILYAWSALLAYMSYISYIQAYFSSNTDNDDIIIATVLLL